jgi:hypothetical protein
VASAAKAEILLSFCGTAKAMPYPKRPVQALFQNQRAYPKTKGLYNQSCSPIKEREDEASQLNRLGRFFCG